MYSSQRVLKEGNWVKVGLPKKLLDSKAVLGPAALRLAVSACFGMPVSPHHPQTLTTHFQGRMPSGDPRGIFLKHPAVNGARRIMGRLIKCFTLFNMLLYKYPRYPASSLPPRGTARSNLGPRISWRSFPRTQGDTARVWTCVFRLLFKSSLHSALLPGLFQNCLL